MSPPKKSAAEHASSLLLSPEANTKIFSLLEPRTQALSTAFVTVVLSRPPKHPEWKPFRTGVATIIKDHTRKAYFLQIYDIVDWEKVREEELTKGTTYQVSLPKFHQLETAKGHAMGLKFSDETEARTFAQVARAITITGQYKTEGYPKPIEINNGKETEDKPQEGSSTQETENEDDELGPLPQSQSLTVNKDLSPSPPEAPSPVNKDKCRPPRPTSVYRDAPVSPPPPPPVKKSTAVSTPAALVNKDAPMTLPLPLPPSEPGRKTPPFSQTVPLHPTATLDRKRQKNRKITKSMIGNPTNFQHVYHVGFDPESSLDEKALQAAVGEASRKLFPARPPPPPPPPAAKRRSSAPAPPSNIPDSANSIVEGDEINTDGLPTAKMQEVTTSESLVTEPEHPPCTDPSRPDSEQPLFIVTLPEPALEIPAITDPVEEPGLVACTVITSVEPEQKLSDDLSSSLMNNIPHSENSLDNDSSDVELQETSDSTLVPDLSTSLDCSLSEVVTSTPDITLTANDSKEDSDDSKQKSLKSMEHCEDHFLTEPTPVDTSKDPDTNSSDLSEEILKSLNELEAKLAEFSDSSSGAETHQIEMNDTGNCEIEDVETQQADYSCESTATEGPFTEFCDSFSVSQRSLLSVQFPINTFDPQEQKNTPASDSVQGSLQMTADDFDLPKAPARQRKKMSQRPTPPPPPPPPTPTETRSPSPPIATGTISPPI